VIRRLAAILAADVAEYSRLMHEDENATHSQFESLMAEAVKPVISRFGGRIVKSTGDGFLAEFTSAVEAVNCALEFQSAMVARAAEAEPERRILLRVGINVGDVIVAENDIYGDHVNLAARLEALADPGGIMVTGTVQEYVRGRLPCQFVDTGERQVKNIARPVRVFRVLPPGEAETSRVAISMGRRRLRVALFGQLTVRVGDQDIAIGGSKLRAVFGCVALSEELRENRDRLAGLLWSESDEPRGRAGLRQSVRELRNRLEIGGYQGLRTSPQDIWLDPGTVDVDALAVLNAAAEGNIHALLLERQRLPDDLLRGLDQVDPAFRGWVLAKRQTYRDRLLRALEQALGKAEAGGPDEGRIALAIFNLDPTHEDACRRLMQERVARGDVAGALRIYQDLQKLLRVEYAMEPAAATHALVTAIKAGSAAATTPIIAFAPRSTAAHPATQLAIFVQPVTVHAIDPERSHLVTGFRQHVIASLIRFRELRIADAPFAGHSEYGAAGIAGRYELLMDAHQNGTALHLMLVLKELGGGSYVWSDEFELNLRNWFASQRSVVQRIAMALNVHLSADRLRRFSEQPEVSLGMHDRWLRCQTLIRTFDPVHWSYAAAQFNAIIDACPNFVPAYCGLADIDSTEHIARPGIFRTREREQEALRFARKAVQLDPADMRAHRTLGWAHAMAKQYAQAMVHMETACELNPNDSWTHISAALLLAFCGEIARAVDLAREALDLTLAPSRTYWAYQTDIEFLSGRYQAAVEASERAQDVLWGVPAWRAAALAHLGRRDEAAAELAQFFARVRTNWHGPKPATDARIMRWLLHLYPISRPEDWERLRDGLSAAGAPVEGSYHHEW
jgi:class 3 adenylate cyclase/DNA-binding SARP family transcriptional activator